MAWTEITRPNMMACGGNSNEMLHTLHIPVILKMSVVMASADRLCLPKI
jgi:hypothetical protein